jgi:hypothetical protein
VLLLTLGLAAKRNGRKGRRTCGNRRWSRRRRDGEDDSEKNLAARVPGIDVEE